jgi:hypothetical protein
MKVLVKNYGFNASLKSVTFNDYNNIKLDQILLITNVTQNIIIYNFAKLELGGTVTSNYITLNYDTTSMSNTDRLQIFIEAPTDSLTTTYSAMSSSFVLSAAAIFELNGISTFGQQQFIQVRDGLNINNSQLVYSGILQPFSNFNIIFSKGINISSGVAYILNSSTPTTIDKNDNNLLFTASYIK